MASYLSFKLSNEYYAAAVSQVNIILEHTEITKVPRMPEYMLGVINHRGKVLPVLDTRIKLGLAPKEIDYNTCIIVSEINSAEGIVNVGLLVDAVAEVLEIEPDAIQDAPDIGNTKKGGHVHGMFYDKEKYIMLMDLEKMFIDTEVIVE